MPHCPPPMDLNYRCPDPNYEREKERERDREGLISVLVKDRERVDHTEFGIGFERIFFCLLDWGI